MVARRGPRAVEIGRADRLVRFLRVLDLALILPRFVRDVAGVVAGRDRPPRGAHRLRRHVDAVGPHVGDEPVLVESLRHAHRVARGKAELARRFLLQRRCRERRRRVARERLGLDRGDGEAARLDHRPGGVGIALVADRQPLDLVAVELGQPCGEALAVRLEGGADRPIFLRLEDLDLALAVDDQAQRDRLHAAGGFGARQLAPQDRRQGEADEIVERAPRPVGVDQILIEPARMLHRLGHRRIGDRVESHALHLRRQRLFLPQHLLDVPADRLTLAVGVGGEDQSIGILRLVGDGLELLRAVGRDLPLHVEAMVGIDRAVLGRQVAHVPERGEHAVARPKILLDGFRLGRRFDDDQLHFLPSRIRVKVGAPDSLRQARAVIAREKSRGSVHLPWS